jgi:hypothetical protein
MSAITGIPFNFNWFSRFRRGRIAPRKSTRDRSRIRKRAIETLEDRTMLKATLYVDFGAGFNGGTMDVEADILGSVPNNGMPTMGLNGPDFVTPGFDTLQLYSATDTITLQSLNSIVLPRGNNGANPQGQSIDFDGNGTANNADYAALHDSVLNILNRIFAPLDVTVVENQAASPADVMSKFDNSGVAYVFVTGAVKKGGMTTVAQDEAAKVNDPNAVFYGDASTVDEQAGTNKTDETALVYADSIATDSSDPNKGFSYDVALANTVAREAARTFGVREAVTDTTAPVSNQALETSSEIMAADGNIDNVRQIGMFSRFPVTGKLGGTVNSYNTLVTNVGASPTIGDGYATGTGAFDELVIQNSMTPGMANVTVTAFANAQFTTQIGMPYTYKLDYSKGLLIDLGRSNDRVAVDGLLGVNVIVRGGQGDSELDVIGDGMVDGMFTPDVMTTSVPGLGDVEGGVLTVEGAKPTVFTMTEFTNTSTAFAVKFNNFTYLPKNANNVSLETSGAPANGGVVAINGQAVDADGVPINTLILEFQDVTNFLVDCTNLKGDDVLTIGPGGLPAEGLTNFEFDGGDGNDTLDIQSTDISLPTAGGAFTYDGGDGVDTIATDADGDFTLNETELDSLGGGSVQLLNLTGEIANLTGGDGNNTLTVQSWSGTGTLEGLMGDDNFVFGTAGDLDTVTGHFMVIGDDGKDTLTLDDSATSDNVNYDVLASTVQIDPSTPQPFGGVDFDGTLDNIVLSGTTGNNTFFVTPNLNTAMRINGNNPPFGTLPPDGDSLKIDFTGIPDRKLVTNISPKAPGNGAWTFSDGHKPITFTSIEHIQSSFVVASSDTGSASKPLVNAYDNVTNQLDFSFYPYSTTFTGGVRVTLADVNDDGVLDVITAPGPGKVPGETGDVVKVYDGAVLSTLALANDQRFVANPALALISSFRPEATTYIGGLYLAAGDVNGHTYADGNKVMDIVTSRSTGSSQVRVFLNLNSAGTKDGFGTSFKNKVSYAPYTAKDRITSGGAVVAVGDMNGDGQDDVVTAPGVGVNVLIKEFEFDFNAKVVSPILLRQFLGFEKTFTRGVSLAVGDLDGDGVDEVMLGAGAGGGSRVRVLNAFGGLIKEFKAYTSGNVNSAVRVAAHEADDRLLLYVAQSNDGRSHAINRFDPLSGKLIDSFFEINPDFNSGIFVG